MFELSGHIDVWVEIDTHVIYGLEKATFDFPKTVEIKPLRKDGSYTLKVSSGSDKLPSLKVGIIPKLIFGIQVFGLKPNVYLTFEAYIEGSIKPKKPIEIKSGEKFDIKKQEVCGEVSSKPTLGQKSPYGIWKPKHSKTLWEHKFDFWKSASCPAAKRELGALDGPLLGNANVSMLSCRALSTTQILSKIPDITKGWTCETSASSPVLAAVAEAIQIIAKSLVAPAPYACYNLTCFS
ncbi:hypothetical protein PC9H_011123 [Pleurotus ostreatus]|uniref:Uncharacterized protein n=1 Tax=Pleurotus ostreatus TaxID=5322 RepID=A0A8H6ZNE2_PLEOS|nr:uncharacterized protein PC9H_011123 [Pleurotus ostreatus]KAF7422959.1 hypothetical protein PC9H_011123 [Pleurotus ostreatus]